MAQTPPDPRADSGPDDVLSMGDGRSPRWGLLGAVLAVLLLGIGTYQVITRPSTPAAPPAAAAADRSGADRSGAVLAGSGRSGLDGDRAQQGPSVRLGHHEVTLSGPDVVQPHREADAVALGRLRGGWLVELTSTACEGRPDPQVSYGVAKASGRFTVWNSVWDSVSSLAGTRWRSPDRTLVLEDDGKRLEVRRTSNGTVVEVFRPAA